MRCIAMKNRTSEFGALSTLVKKQLLPEAVFPYVEIISEETVKDGTEDQTIVKWLDLVPGRKVFIEYFRCDLDKYKNYSPKNISLVMQLNNNLSMYQDRILALLQYQDVIPVIAVKKGIDRLSVDEIGNLIGRIRQIDPRRSIALRLEDLDGLERVIKAFLNKWDYLIYDIGENHFRAGIMEYEDLRQIATDATTILMCSPRPRNLNNGNYEDGKPTDLIDNDGAARYEDFGFSGYCDYGGLRDNLPSAQGGGRGHALALLYDCSINQYWAYVCEDSKLGPKGFQQVVSSLLKNKERLNPNGDCLAFNEIERQASTGHFGNYQNWTRYTLIRSIQQIAKLN